MPGCQRLDGGLFVMDRIGSDQGTVIHADSIHWVYQTCDLSVDIVELVVRLGLVGTCDWCVIWAGRVSGI
jgi:hypothetical protein